ncbi:MAG: hypothetical protein GF317_14785 [Candidatus Lokiarchaeota archaeon]|nr:hypothetical protein [Candidatus Lokiarchaeota archaeon]
MALATRFRDSKGRFSKPDGRKKQSIEIYETKTGEVVNKSGLTFGSKRSKGFIAEKLKREVKKDRYDKIIEVELKNEVRKDLSRSKIESRTEGYSSAIIQLENIQKQTKTENKVTLTPINLELPIEISKGERKGEFSTRVDKISYAIRDFLRSLGYAITSKNRRRKGSKQKTIRNKVIARIFLVE